MAGETNAEIVRLAHFFDIFRAQHAMLVTIVYGPIAAALVELFPMRIRYAGMSLPHHIGNGSFGGLMPATAFAMIAQSLLRAVVPDRHRGDDLDHRHSVRAGELQEEHLRG